MKSARSSQEANHELAYSDRTVCGAAASFRELARVSAMFGRCGGCARLGALAHGLQYQRVAAFGGLEYIEFLAEERVIVNLLRIWRDYLNEFESSPVIAFTRKVRRSDSIIKEPVPNLDDRSAREISNPVLVLQ